MKEYTDGHITFNRELLLLFLEKIEVLSEEERELVFKVIKTYTHTIFKL